MSCLISKSNDKAKQIIFKIDLILFFLSFKFLTSMKIFPIFSLVFLALLAEGFALKHKRYNSLANLWVEYNRKMINDLELLLLNSLISIFSIPLNRMKTSRRTMEDLDVSRNKIARRWGSGGYGSKFPEEPITNYLDVRIRTIN